MIEKKKRSRSRDRKHGKSKKSKKERRRSRSYSNWVIPQALSHKNLNNLMGIHVLAATFSRGIENNQQPPSSLIGWKIGNKLLTYNNPSLFYPFFSCNFDYKIKIIRATKLRIWFRFNWTNYNNISLKLVKYQMVYSL